jgi:cbb3-type cytochrome oxidase maturation protein
VEVVLILIPVSAVVVLAAVGVFLWAVDHGQFEDLERQGREALFEESTGGAAPPRADGSNTWSS